MNKIEWVAKHIEGKTLVVTFENKEAWQAQKGVELVSSVDTMGSYPNSAYDVIVLEEVLEEVDDPIAIIKEAKRIGKKVVITVPNEYGWQAQNQPFKNQRHKRFYDTDMLTEHLDSAGVAWKVELIVYAGWSFFGVIVW